MADPYHHAVSSARQFGGQPEDYLAIHKWFDHSKMLTANFTHRMLRHHTEGIETACDIFGQAIEVKVTVDGAEKVKMVPVRWIGEQHMLEDFGRIPTALDWINAVTPQPWMNRSRKLSRELGDGRIAVTPAVATAIATRLKEGQ